MNDATKATERAAHEQAVRDGADGYADPTTVLFVFTIVVMWILMLVVMVNSGPHAAHHYRAVCVYRRVPRGARHMLRLAMPTLPLPEARVGVTVTVVTRSRPLRAT
jgi:hypothetical protein